MHHEKLYQTYAGVNIPVHQTLLHVKVKDNHAHTHVPVEGTVSNLNTCIVCQLNNVCHK
jgi:hypothetical protein